MHSNGYSLVNKILFEDSEYALDHIFPELGRPLGDELLTPTRIYVPKVLSLLHEVPIRGMAHITGGGIAENLQRIIPDGCVVLIHDGKPRIVAEGICFANGLTLDAAEKNIYVAETMKRRILRYAIRGDGSLTGPEVYGPDFLGRLGFPDGIAFDEAGNLWTTFPLGNAVGYLTPGQELIMAIEDPEGLVLRRPSNICFGWEGRKTAFIGSLEGTNIPYFEAPNPGMRLIHQVG